jgi:hypothetical protein
VGREEKQHEERRARDAAGGAERARRRFGPQRGGSAGRRASAVRRQQGPELYSTPEGPAVEASGFILPARREGPADPCVAQLAERPGIGIVRRLATAPRRDDARAHRAARALRERRKRRGRMPVPSRG